VGLTKNVRHTLLQRLTYFVPSCTSITPWCSLLSSLAAPTRSSNRPPLCTIGRYATSQFSGRSLMPCFAGLATIAATASESSACFG
jgi:hypothetical protein